MSIEFQIFSAPVSPEAGHVLGGARLGLPAPDAAAWPEQAVLAPLGGENSLREAWVSSEACQSGLSEEIHWRRTGDLLYGVIELSEVDFAAEADGRFASLQRLSQVVYERIFRLLDAQGLPCLWRVWNYIPAINAESNGLERYRQFNIGRQDAFIVHQRDAVGNVPAACALGVAEGPLSIAFLAGKLPATPIENPRQVSAYEYPADYGPRSPTFSRAALVYPPDQEILFISGTASIIGHQTVHVGDLAGQCRESMANITAVVSEANRHTRGQPYQLGQLIYRVYFRHAADLAAVQAVLTPMLQGAPLVSYVQADVCRADLLVEIEAFAVQPLGAV